MKTPFDPRHQRRKQIVQLLFEWGFRKEEKNNQAEIEDIVKNLEKIDNLITKSAPQWPIDQINKVDLAILRLAIYELVITRKEPEKVVVDEAVELAKEFGGESSPAFVNGVLGNILKEEVKE